jgi:hypothetical protein
MEFLDTNFLTKNSSSLLLHVTHGHFYWQILQKNVHNSGFFKSIKKSAKKIWVFMNSSFKKGKTRVENQTRAWVWEDSSLCPENSTKKQFRNPISGLEHAQSSSKNLLGDMQRYLNDSFRTRLSVVWFGSSPTFSPLSVSKPTDETQEDKERETTCWQERGEGVEPRALREGHGYLLFLEGANYELKGKSKSIF